MDWKQIKEDISKGLKDGFESVKDGAETVAKKAEELSLEGQKKVKAYNLKKRIQEDMEELGVLLYNVEKSAPGTIGNESARELIAEIEQKFRDLEKLEKS